MATREGIIAALKRKGYNGPEVQETQQAGLTNDPYFDNLIQQAVRPKNIGNRVGDAISILGGGKASEGGDDYSKLFAQEAIKNRFENDPNSLDYKTKQANLGLINERTKLAQAGYVQDENTGQITKVDAVRPESSTERIFKKKELDELAAQAEITRQQSGLVENAIPAIQNIDRGALANAKRSWNKFFGQDNPDLADWQSLKSLLTGIQLDMSDRTKGAISDREMETFQKAVANDDFATAMQQTKVLGAYYNKIHGGLESKMAAYEDMFNEDPRQFKSMQNLPQKQQNLFSQQSGNGSTKAGNKFRKVG